MERTTSDLATMLHGRAVVHEMLNDLTAAAADFDRAIEIRRQLVNQGPLDALQLTVGLEERSIRLLRSDRYPEAIGDLTEAIETRKRLVDESVDREGATAALAIDLSYRGAAFLATSRLHEALTDLSEAIEIWTRDSERDLSVTNAAMLAGTHKMRAAALYDLGEQLEAAEALQCAVNSYSTLAQADEKTVPLLPSA